MWLNDFKIAIIEKDTQKIDKLLDETPKFTELKDMQEASYLMREAFELIHKLKDETGATMTQLKKNMDFLDSTQLAETQNRLDIKL